MTSELMDLNEIYKFTEEVLENLDNYAEILIEVRIPFERFFLNTTDYFETFVITVRDIHNNIIVKEITLKPKEIADHKRLADHIRYFEAQVLEKVGVKCEQELLKIIRERYPGSKILNQDIRYYLYDRESRVEIEFEYDKKKCKARYTFAKHRKLADDYQGELVLYTDVLVQFDPERVSIECSEL